MNQELTSSFGLLERRLALMRELAGSLEQAQGAILRSDLAGVDGQTAQQREICEALRQLKTEALGHASCTVITDNSRHQNVRLPRDHSVPPHVGQRWTALARELAEVEVRVNQLNQVYGALLRRARRTVQIFNRVLASSAITYIPPKPEVAVVPSTFQEVSHG